MGDLGDVALDAPEEKEERREEKLMMSMEGSVHLQIQVRLVGGGGGGTLLSSSAFPSAVVYSHFTL